MGHKMKIARYRVAKYRIAEHRICKIYKTQNIEQVRKISKDEILKETYRKFSTESKMLEI